MERTKKAEQQLVDLAVQKENLERDLQELTQKQRGGGFDHVVYRAYERERNRIFTRICNIEQRIDEVTKTGLSTTEMSGIVRAASAPGSRWETVKTDRSMGCRGYVKVGYYKPLARFFEVSYTAFSNFMRNVRGCASLANKNIANHVISLTDEEVRERLATVERHGFTRESTSVMQRTPEQVLSVFHRMIE